MRHTNRVSNLRGKNKKKSTPRLDKGVPFRVVGAVPMLQYCENCNLLEFRKKLSIHAMEELGDIARLLETLDYYVPDAVAIEDYDLGDDFMT